MIETDDCPALFIISLSVMPGTQRNHAKYLVWGFREVGNCGRGTEGYS